MEGCCEEILFIYFFVSCRNFIFVSFMHEEVTYRGNGRHAHANSLADRNAKH